MPIRAVIFDLGNVVLPFDHRRACRAAARGTTLSAEEVYRRVWGTDLVRRFDRGDLAPRAFFAELRQLIGYRGRDAELRRAWNDIFRPDPAMARLVRDLAARLPLVLLSNTNRAHFEFVRRRFPVVRLFRRRVLSYEAGLLKPDPAIYRLAVAKARADLGECLYVDDLPAYVTAASALGLLALRFLNARQLRRDVMRRLDWNRKGREGREVKRERMGEVS
jgi:HAD superfamily hydrolase (TIGR01509 family)